ncbi:multicatalytic endopeptidase [Elasticomyces elasticus]|nr:multicatalytic endopeptidase [Elasticomyces elasticus]
MDRLSRMLAAAQGMGGGGGGAPAQLFNMPKREREPTEDEDETVDSPVDQQEEDGEVIEDTGTGSGQPANHTQETQAVQQDLFTQRDAAHTRFTALLAAFNSHHPSMIRIRRRQEIINTNGPNMQQQLVAENLNAPPDWDGNQYLDDMGNIPAPPLLDAPLSPNEMQAAITASFARLQVARDRPQPNFNNDPLVLHRQRVEEAVNDAPVVPDPAPPPQPTQAELDDLQSRITAASNRLQEAIRDPAINCHRLDMTSLPDVPFDPPPTLPGRRNAVLHDGDPPHGRNRRNTDPYPGPHRRRRDTNIIDNAETVYISSLALLKMLRHGRAGVPMEVMGLMLGEFVDDYTVRVVDVFAMPQSGTGVSVEAVDPVFQTKMMDMLRQTGRPETVVGWYHSHPGFGCWLSSVDINTQQSFEQLTPRAVAVVIDPIQSVKGKVVIDAFRLINPQTLMLGQEPRQTTSNLGHLNKPSIQALIHGLNRHYYSIGIGYRKTALEEGMLMNLHKSVWTEALAMPDFKVGSADNLADLTKLVSLAEGYEKRVVEEGELTKEELRTRYVGRVDPKKHLQDVGERVMEGNLVGVLRGLIGKEAGLPAAQYGDKQGGANGVGGGVHGGGEGMEVDEEL